MSAINFKFIPFINSSYILFRGQDENEDYTDIQWNIERLQQKIDDTNFNYLEVSICEGYEEGYQLAVFDRDEINLDANVMYSFIEMNKNNLWEYNKDIIKYFVIEDDDLTKDEIIEYFNYEIDLLKQDYDKLFSLIKWANENDYIYFGINGLYSVKCINDTNKILEEQQKNIDNMINKIRKDMNKDLNDVFNKGE